MFTNIHALLYLGKTLCIFVWEIDKKQIDYKPIKFCIVMLKKAMMQDWIWCSVFFISHISTAGNCCEIWTAQKKAQTFTLDVARR